MSNEDLIRAWKDEEYRKSLGETAPQHPSGLVELTDEALENMVGAAVPIGDVEGSSCGWSSCNAEAAPAPGEGDQPPVEG